MMLVEVNTKLSVARARTIIRKAGLTACKVVRQKSTLRGGGEILAVYTRASDPEALFKALVNAR